MFLLLCIYEITLNWICFRGMDIFGFFPWICYGECAKLLQILIVKYFPIWCKFRVFSERLLKLLIVRTGGEEEMHIKVAICFYLKVLKLVNLTYRRGEKFEIITSSPCKRKLQRDQKKISKSNKNQIRPK